MRRVLAFVVLSLLASPAVTRASKTTKLLKNSLMTVVEPHGGEPAHAHPFVNIIVTFGALSDGTPADPSTFKVRLGHDDLTKTFTPMVDAQGRLIGMRGKLEQHLVKLGHRPKNHVRLTVQSVRRVGAGKGPRILRDIDRLRFGAIDAPDQPCTAQADSDTSVIVPGIPVHFTGSKATSDPDRDELTYLWDFGDGSSSTDPDPTHLYAEAQGAVRATLTASDGQLSCTGDVVLEAVPPLPPGKTAGALFVDSTTTLEMGDEPRAAPSATRT